MLYRCCRCCHLEQKLRLLEWPSNQFRKRLFQLLGKPHLSLHLCSSRMDETRAPKRPVLNLQIVDSAKKGTVCSVSWALALSPATKRNEPAQGRGSFADVDAIARTFLHAFLRMMTGIETR